MKKLLTMLAVMLALVLACTGLAMAEKVDDDNDSTMGGISYEDATRIHEIDGHTVSNPRVERESTCTERGIVRFDCETDPSHWHELYLELAPHTWTEWKGEADCTHAGTQTRKCKVCGKEETRTVKALGHDWASSHADINKNWGKVTKDPTCMEEGEAVDYCLRCGVENPDILPRKIEKIPHAWKEVKDTDPTCLGNGIGHYECEYGCGTKLYEHGELVTFEILLPVGEDGHDWDAWVVQKGNEPTCYADGKAIRWCKRCGDKQEKVLPALEADYVVDKDLDRLIDCYHLERTYKCSICGSKADKNGYIAHPAYTVIEDVVAHHFKHEEEYEVAHIEPTCEKDGFIAYKCVWFDEDTERHELDDKALEFVTLPATGHKWSEWEERVAPGEGDNEYGYYLRECTVCHKTEEMISKVFPGTEEKPAEEVKNGLVEEDGKKRLYVDGVASDKSGLTNVGEDWYFLANGYVDESFTGLAPFAGNWWTVVNGKLINRDANGLVEFQGQSYMISEGMVWTDWDGIHWLGTEAYLLARGAWQSSYSGIYPEGSNIILITNGKVDHAATSTTISGVEYAVVNGIVQMGK